MGRNRVGRAQGIWIHFPTSFCFVHTSFLSQPVPADTKTRNKNKINLQRGHTRALSLPKLCQGCQGQAGPARAQKLGLEGLGWLWACGAEAGGAGWGRGASGRL